MKILQIANGDFFSTYGGGQVYVKNLVDEMIRQHLDVTVISFVNKKSNFPVQKQEYKGIDLYEIYRKNPETIKHIIREISPDIIHIHAEKALLSKISKGLNIPNVITAHHGGILCPAGTLMNCKDEICKVPVNYENCLPCVLRNTKTGSFFYPLLKRIPVKNRLKIGKLLYKIPFIYFVTPLGISTLQIKNKKEQWDAIVQNAGTMIAPSGAIAQNMILNAFPKEKIQVIPHGIPNFLEPTNQVCHDNKPVKFFYVGRICYVKGIHLLLDAFAQLNPSQSELHLIGDTEGEYQQKLINKYKKNNNVFFHGKVQPEEVAKQIRNLDVLVHPAIYLEVFGLNIAEALLEGKPVIATRCGGAEMQIDDKENGLLIEPNSIEELKNAMQWMIDCPAERQRIAKNAAEKVVSMGSHVKNIVNLYQNKYTLA